MASTYYAAIDNIFYLDTKADNEHQARENIKLRLHWERAEGLLLRWWAEGAEVVEVRRNIKNG